MEPSEKPQVLDASVRGAKPYAPQPSDAPAPEPRRRGRPPKTKHTTEAATRPPEQRRQPAESAQPTPPRTEAPKPKQVPPIVPTTNELTRQKRNQRGRKPAAGVQTVPLHIGFLGGINEVGKNMTVYEYNGERLVVDCGMSFPDAETPGVDVIIPDFAHLVDHFVGLQAIFITHGHEDHIGALPYLLKKMNVPIYATRLTLGLIRGKLKEHRLLDRARLFEVKPGDVVQLGEFSIETIHVNHSIPDALALAITTKAGVVIQTGDFKIDTTPIDGEMIDLAKFADYGKKGVLALLSDSTNAERPGYTMSESKVGESFETLFRRAGDRRLLVATFSSNVHRVQQIIDVAEQLGRKVALLGRSLENVVSVGMELGYLHVPEGLLIPVDLINRYPHEKVVIITTGSQGEPMSALTRMAFSDHRKVELTPNDCVIISATPIPGNEKTVGRVVNELLKLGAHVVYEKMYDVHVSGHACQEELKIMLGLVRPKFFIPVHGEQKHLVKHAQLAQSMGMDPGNIMLVDNGIQLELTPEELKVTDSIAYGSVYVDGSGVGDVGSAVIRDRKHLAQEGMIIVAVCVNPETGELVSGPEIISRGFVYVKGSEDLMQAARDATRKVVAEATGRLRQDWVSVRGKIREDVSRLMYEKTRRSPLVLPVLLEG